MRFLTCVIWLTTTVVAATGAAATGEESDLVRSVEQQRGGRHWIDKPTEPPKSAEESLACFQLEPGCRIELVAAEPIVLDPVAIEFDELGRMFVAEYGDYPVGPSDPEAPRLSRIVLLQDEDRDGRMDHRTVFADNLAFCHSLMPLMGGILTCTETEIVFLKDTTGDHVADVREVWFSGFTPAHPQMQIGCPRRGFDNWIYLTYGPGDIRCRRPGFETETPVELSGLDFRFHPLTMEFESVTGLGQFGNTFDDDGHRFFSTNRNPIMTDLLPRSALNRNPFAGLSKGHTDVGPAGEDTRVYPLVDMKSNWLSHAGTHTSACGVTAYRGDLFDDSFRHSVFVCEPVGHLVTRSIIRPDGASLTADRARPAADFIASTDTWFRPASLANAPDGTIVLADMYRLWVEHPKFVPDDVAAKMDWRAGEDRGRIWRIVPDPPAATRSLPATSTAADLVALLRDNSGWRRQLGQRLLVERQSADAAPLLRSLLQDARATPHARMHALWTLDGLQQLTSDDVGTALGDPHPLVRRDAVRLVGIGFSGNARLLQRAAALCEDENSEVRLQALLAMAFAEPEVRSGALSRAAADIGADPWLSAALLSSSETCSGVILTQLVAAGRTAAETASSLQPAEALPSPARPSSDLLRKLARVTAARGDLTELQHVLELIVSDRAGPSWWQTTILLGIADGLPASGAKNVPRNLHDLLAQPPSSLVAAAAEIRQLLAQAAAVSKDTQRSEADRLAAVRLLPYQPADVLTEAIGNLLQPNETTALQTAAMDAVRSSGRAEMALLLLNHWETLKPVVRSQTLDLLLNRPETIADLLQRMTAGTIAPSVVSLDQRLRLLQHPDAAIRAAASTLFGGTVSADRREVADTYQPALALPASAADGARVFEKSCSKCHRIDGVGQQVGPDISDTRSRARDALLYDILDPNRRVDPKYTDHIVITQDGRTLSGLLMAETSDTIVLRQPGGIEQTIARQEIDELRATNRSLMPEGVEKEISVQQMADLLEFLKSR